MQKFSPFFWKLIKKNFEFFTFLVWAILSCITFPCLVYILQNWICSTFKTACIHIEIWCLSDWTGGVSLLLGYGITSLADLCPTFKTAWWYHLLCLHFSTRCDTSILWLISMHRVTCFVTNRATVFTYSDHVGSMYIWCHSGTLLELVLLARKVMDLNYYFWTANFHMQFLHGCLLFLK